MKRQGKGKSYVVFVGRRPGIYSSWGECYNQVNGFPNNLHDSFNTREAAVTAWNNFWAGSEPPSTGNDMAATTEIQQAQQPQQVHCSGDDTQELGSQSCLAEVARVATHAKENVPVLENRDQMSVDPFTMGVMLGFIIGVVFLGAIVIMFK